MRRLLIILGSLVITAVLAYVAFLLGAVGFDARRFTMHEARLERLLKQGPRLEQVVEALEQEGSPLIETPSNPSELRAAASRRAGAKEREVLEKGTTWPHTRVFRAGDMIYFIYFDDEGVMKDFTLVSG